MKVRRIFASVVFYLCLTSGLFAAGTWNGPSAQEAFDKPNLYGKKELYNMARQALATGCLTESRLFALRLFFDGNRNQNLLNLLGVIEIQNSRLLLASEWFRKANALSLGNKLAQRYLTRLPKRPRAIPVDPSKLSEHFAEISAAMPGLTERLTNKKLHMGSIFKTLERGQFYMALALAEEYEKRYHGAESSGLTALCAWYLGRNKDALDIVNANLKAAPYNELLLFVKAMVQDAHPATSSQSYFRALYDLDQWQKALSLTESYSKQHPTSPDAYITQARIYLDMNKIKEAAEALQKAGVRDPGNPETELLWVSYLLQRGENQKAAVRLNKTFKRGYNMPSVSLASALLAMQNGNYNEVGAVLNEIGSYRPFNDPEGYPGYVTLLLLCDKNNEAKEALEEWKQRSGELSILCYLEAFYNFKMGFNKEALGYLRKAYQKGPNRLGMLQFMSGFQALADDPKLFSEVNSKITQSSMGLNARLYKPVKLKALKKNANAQRAAQRPVQKPVKAAPANEPQVKSINHEGFVINLGEGLDSSHAEPLLPDLTDMYSRVASIVGQLKNKIKINYVSAEGLGPLIACYEPSNSLVTLTTNYFDSSMVQNIIRANFDSFGEEELDKVVNSYSSHVLCAEIAKLAINEFIGKSEEARNKAAWMRVGLSEITAGSPIVLRYKLLLAHQSITNGTAKLASINMLNSIFAEGYTSPAVYETASAQSYLMCAYLMKRSGSLAKGCADMMKMIKQVSEGKAVSDTVKSIFKITEAEFEAGWKESAYCAMTQGAPYEW